MRHHQQIYLERLCKKLQFRYGLADDDDLVMQLKQELEFFGGQKPMSHAKPYQYRRKEGRGESSVVLH